MVEARNRRAKTGCFPRPWLVKSRSVRSLVGILLLVICVLRAVSGPETTRTTTAITGIADNQLAYEQSYGFFDDISDENWKYRQQLAGTRKDHARGVDPKAAPGDSRVWYLNNYYPAFACPNVLRIAREPGDGPKYICDPHRLPAVAEKRRQEEGTDIGCIVYR